MKKATLGIRASPELKLRLLAAGERNDRSLSAESEVRLEISFAIEETLDAALDLVFDRDVAALVLLLGKTVRETADLTGFFAANSGRKWLDDPYTFEHVVQAIAEVLESLRPEGEITPPILQVGGDALKLMTGPVLARGLLDQLPGDQPPVWAVKIRERFGNAILERIVQWRRRKIDEFMRRQPNPAKTDDGDA
jgi:hypothetical protein